MNPKNRASVEDALRQELERDRTKTYVVEISPLGLVEMTRQNVTDGPREILTRKCPTCAGEGVVVSEATAVVDAERRLRALAASKPRTKAFKVELNAHVAELMIGSGAATLCEIEASTRRRFFLVGKAAVPHDHFTVLDEGTVEKLAPADGPVSEGQTLELKLGEVGRHDARAGVGKLDGVAIVVWWSGQARRQKVSIHVERVLDGVAYRRRFAGPLRRLPASRSLPSQAEKPDSRLEGEEGGPSRDREVGRRAGESRARRLRRSWTLRRKKSPEPARARAEVVEAEGGEPAPDAPPKKKTRRGSRGGRGRKKTRRAVDAPRAGTFPKCLPRRAEPAPSAEEDTSSR